MEKLNHALRFGNFTSSEIAALTTMGSREMNEEEMRAYKVANPKGKKKNIDCWPGKPAITYIQEKIYERNHQRPLSVESNAKPLVWGKFCESLLFNLLGLAYTLSSTETIIHPKIPYWSGTPDATKEDTVCDIKCPFTLKSFSQLVHPLYEGVNGIEAINFIRENHKSGEDYYWQLVSNSILTDKPFAELIIYCPYESEIEAIKAIADGDPEAGFIQWSKKDELPYLIENRFYNNINIIRFEVPQSDKDLLTDCVLKAGKLLFDNKNRL